MEILKTELPDVLRIRPRVFGDDRGFFLELYHSAKFAQQGLQTTFVQDNLSRSRQGVLRGLHYQIQHAQGKLVTCLSGDIFDVAVDLRKSSTSFGKWIGVRLTSENRESLYIPPGFAHGFCVLSESADVLYKCTELYHPEHERSLLWNDPDIGIDWPLTGEPTLTDKDRRGATLANAECYS
ncbi:dTDP-4-dehydrorhamnose 3,5-epimerase [Planctomicrobium sp. SH661]|uniref:dTDP-4-dehydrorhamnose 3,5-epimerase n=1 Tax=Planctomicrobium sp. SH661 TaxID=3448124 RepID=UPI003F5B2A34